MTARCTHCSGRGSTADPLHVLQRIVPDGDTGPAGPPSEPFGGRPTIRLFLHERCVGTWVLRNPTMFIRSDVASDPLQAAPLMVPAEITPTCEACGDEAASGIFIRTNGTSGDRRPRLFCAGCGFRVVPGSTNRLLAQFTPGDLPSGALRELLESIGDWIEMDQSHTDITALLRKRLARRG